MIQRVEKSRSAPEKEGRFRFEKINICLADSRQMYKFLNDISELVYRKLISHKLSSMVSELKKMLWQMN